jgi:FMN phosphatase YigB (HAD superfamily)
MPALPVQSSLATNFTRVQPQSPIRAVTFDVGDTLMEVWPSVDHVFAEVTARQGVDCLSAGLVGRRFAAAWKAARRLNYSRSGWVGLGWNERGRRRLYNDGKDKSL